MSDEEKKIIIDEDWKSQVEREKQEAAQQTSAEPQSSGNDPPAADTPEDPVMPPASIAMLMSSLATEAMISLGAMPHPATGQTTVRRNQAKYLIDTLDMLKQKTVGNLTPDEARALDDVLHQLRMAYVGVPGGAQGGVPGGGA